MKLTFTPPDVDRCRCRHSVNAHQPPLTPADRMLLTIPEEAFTRPPCLRCDCQLFTPRPAPWRVAYRPMLDDDCSLVTLWPWLVLSPRGTIAYAMAERNSALNLARHMAGVEEMLARVNRLERNTFGDHPSLRAAARNAMKVSTLRSLSTVEGPVSQ